MVLSCTISSYLTLKISFCVRCLRSCGRWLGQHSTQTNKASTNRRRWGLYYVNCRMTWLQTAPDTSHRRTPHRVVVTMTTIVMAMPTNITVAVILVRLFQGVSTGIPVCRYPLPPVEKFSPPKIKPITVFIARQHTYARYWYSKSVCPSVCPLRSGIR